MSLQSLKMKALFLSELYRKKKKALSEDDSDDEWEEEALLNLMAIECELRVKGKRFPQPKLANYVEKIIPKYTFERFQTNFRMMPATVDVLENRISLILERQGAVGRIPIPPRKQILSVIWLLGTPDSYRSVGEKFGMSKSTLHHCFQRVIHAICGLVKSQIYWPHGAEAEEIKHRFQKISGMPNVIGAIDGCQVEIDAPKKKRDNSRQTGSGGGLNSKLTQVDEFVFQIVGRDTPALDGLEVAESDPLPTTSSTPASALSQQQSSPVEPALVQPTIRSIPTEIPLRKSRATGHKEKLMSLKEKKFELVNKYLFLKIKKLEKELSEPSSFSNVEVEYLESDSDDEIE